MYENILCDVIVISSGAIAFKRFDELEDLIYPLSPVQKTSDKKLKVQCFGNFDIFDQEGNPVKFARKRSMELFAYLVSKRGSRCTTQELISTLFYDDESETKKLNDRFQQAVTSLARGLRNIGAQDVLVRSFKNYAIDVNLVDCDYYHFLEGDMRAVNAYQGEFMSQYEWAEFIIGYLEEQKKIF